MMWRVLFLFAVYRRRPSTTTVLADLSLSPKFSEKARDPSTAGASRIVSGWEAQEGQFPHMIALRMVNFDGSLTLCGGTNNHAEWGLTAAHCTRNKMTLIISAGSINRDRPLLTFETNKWYNNPLYNESLLVSQPNDIGLISFGRKIDFSATIQPIRIQRSEVSFHNYEGTKAIATGWGRLWTDGALPLNLNWVYLNITSNPECSRAWGFHPIVQETSICGRYYNVTSQSICLGDSGGPLTIIDDDGVLTQVGVCAFVAGSGCHNVVPSGFVRPGPYHDWFTEVTGIDFDWHYDPAEDSKESS